VIAYGRCCGTGRELDIRVLESCNNTAGHRKNDDDDDEPEQGIVITG